MFTFESFTIKAMEQTASKLVSQCQLETAKMPYCSFHARQILNAGCLQEQLEDALIDRN